MMKPWLASAAVLIAVVLPAAAADIDPQRMETLELVPGESLAGFDGESTLHGFTGKTSAVSGQLQIRLAGPGSGMQANFSADAATLDTGNSSRDKKMLKLLEVEKHPQIVFELSSFTPSKTDVETGVVGGLARGMLSVRGTEQPLELELTGKLAGGVLSVEGRAPISLKSYGIKPPRVLGFIRVADEVQIWVKLRLRLTAQDDRQ